MLTETPLLSPIRAKTLEITDIFHPNALSCSFKRDLVMRLASVSRWFASAPGQVDIEDKDLLPERPRGPVLRHFKEAKCLYQITIVFSIALFLAAWILPSQLTNGIGTTAGANANVEYGTFQAPSANVRPRFRYWLPDASVSSDQVADDIRDAGRVGAGGVELLGYYLYGNVQFWTGNYSPLQSDWTVYHFGSPAWSEILFPFANYLHN
jgi:hypothetical protein